MFTGIIQELGVIKTIREERGGARLTIGRRGRGALRTGESIAVDGVCLTAISSRNGTFQADLSPETLSRTALGEVRRGSRVNLERPLRLSDRLGGHLVQGHVDAVGRLESISSEGDFVTCRWSFPIEFSDLVISKGSVAVNGVSLTIVEPEESSFGAALIPQTLQHTNLGLLEPGDPVNLEFDIIGKFIARLALPYLKKH